MLHQALAASDPNHNVSLENYRDIWLDLVGQAVVYPRATGHPRVAVLGVFEARLAHASHVILASFNEGDWPRDPGLDPWLSRAMRRNFGLPARERGTGRLAADLMQWVQAPHVLITRSRRTQGTITPASRWLDRLDVVYGAHHGGAFFPRYTPARPAPPKPIITPNLGKRPGPCPPVALRPFTYSASNIQDLMTNPYQFYARKILRLRPLDPFDQPFDARLMGTLIHSVLDTLIKHGLDPTDPKWNTHATQILDQTLAQTLPNPASRWSVRPRIKMALENFRVQDIQWRAQTGALPIATETTWEAPLTLATGQTITLQARLDRLDAAATGEWMIIDYKTGANLPPKKDCRSGLAPQLPIQEWVVNRGTPVDGIQRSGIMSSAHFWPISPRTGEMVSFAAQAQTSVFPDTDHGLLSLLTVFLDPTTPYWPYPDPARPTKGDDYHHLMRFDEWWGIDDHGGTP
jgi:ATP-dependent helicase/nuclease subunit B